MHDVEKEEMSLSTMFKWAAGAGVLAGGTSLVTGSGFSTAASVALMSTMVAAPALAWLDMGVRAVKKLLGKFKKDHEEPEAGNTDPENSDPSPALEASIENSPASEPEEPGGQKPDHKADIWRLITAWGQEDSVIPAVEVGLLKQRLAEEELDSASDESWQDLARATAPDWKKAVAEGRHQEVWPEVLAADVRAAHMKLARSFARSAAEYQPPGPEKQGFERIEFDSGAYYRGLVRFELEKAGLNPDTAVARFAAGLSQPS